MADNLVLAADLRRAAATLVASCATDQLSALTYDYGSDVLRRWTYLPRVRPGLLLGNCSKQQRLVIQEMIGLVLSESCHAQVAAIMATEDILNRREGYRRGRHYTDFWVLLFGSPDSHSWVWRIEGHHLCINVAVDGSSVLVSPLFLGCHPAVVQTPYGDVTAPLGNEERLARQLLLALPDDLRRRALLSVTAPADIYTSNLPDVSPAGVWPPAAGIRGADLDGPALRIAGELLGLYSQRVSAAVAAQPGHELLDGDWSFCWEGGKELGDAHYYRLQADKWIVELCNSSNQANHIHNVFRRIDEFPGSPSSELR